jgi:cleavage and polyadenylation specificity factor subunit 1
MVSEAGIKPLPKHVAAIQEFPVPTTIKQLQQFLGMINFYRRFLPKIVATLRLLTDLLRGNPKTLGWSAPAAEAFEAAKSALIRAVPLTHPAPGATLSLVVDASDSHVGGVLQQLENRAWRPLAFFSQKLTPTQVRYSTFDRELLAAYTAVRHFRFLLEGRQFRIITDHKPLVSGMTRVTPPSSARQQRHLSFLAEFTSDIRHTSGRSNIVVDTLSRPPSHNKVSAAATVLTLPAIAKLAVDLHASSPSQMPVPPALPRTADEHSSGQGFGSGSVSGSAWIRINLSCWIRIRIRIQIADPDPDPGGKK